MKISFSEILERLTSKETLVIFAPSNQLGSNCGVQKLQDVLRHLNNKLIVQSGRKELVRHFDESSSAYLNNRVILFAHPNIETSSFWANEENLANNWWVTEDNRCVIDYLFAFVCEGSKVLRRKEWESVFRNWISFNEEVFIYVGSDKAINTYKELFTKIVREMNTISESDYFVEIVKNKFINAYRKTYNTYNERKGDQLVLISLEIALSTMEYSQNNL